MLSTAQAITGIGYAYLTGAECLAFLANAIAVLTVADWLAIAAAVVGVGTAIWLALHCS